MKYKISYLLLASALLFAGCDTSEFEQQYDGLTGIDITVSTVSLDRIITKADEVVMRNGINELNENRIMTLDFYLYNNNDLENPVASGHLDAEAQAVKRFKVDLKEGEDFSTLFGSNSTATLYAIANYPSNPLTKLDYTESVDELKQIVVREADFSTTKHKMDAFIMAGQSTVEKKSQYYAEGEIEVKRTAAKFSVNAMLQKDLYEEVLVDQKGTETGNKIYWKPALGDNSMKAQFFYGGQYGTLDENYSVSPSAYSDFYFNSDQRVMNIVGKKDNFNVYSPDPFYTCARSWDYGDKEEPYILLTINKLFDHAEGPDAAAIADTASVHGPYPCFYKILLSDKSFQMNHWYDIWVNILLLGSWDPSTPTTTVSADYYVADWNGYSGLDAPGTTANVEGVRFLQMNQSKYEIYDLPSIEIPYFTSHQCKITKVVKTHGQYSSGTYNPNTNEYTTDAAITSQGFSLAVVGDQPVVKFNHPLIHDWGNTMDVTPYEYEITIEHIDDASYTKTFTLVQYPPIVISSLVNTASGTGWTAGSRGDVYVNGQTRYLIEATSSGGTSVNTDPGADAGTYRTYSFDTNGSAPRYNTIRTRSDIGDRTMYVVETKILPEGTNYIIADPRMTTPNVVVYPEGLGKGTDPQQLFPHPDYSIEMLRDQTEVGLSSAPALYGTTPRKMLYYYATAATDESKNYISPKFRISSNYGSAGQIGGKGQSTQGSANEFANYESWLKRCATYQEAGYPAGRWRLPTFAEIKYVAQLQQYSLLPSIFKDNYYPCSTGLIEVNSNRIANENVSLANAPSIRCVYDDWYWENTDSMVQNATYKTEGGRLPADGNGYYGTFVWGDMPR